MAPLPTADQRHPWLRYQDLAVRLRMEYTGGEGQQVFVSHAWRRLFRIRAPLVREFILEFLNTCRMSDTEIISGRGQAHDKVTDVDLFYLRGMDRGTTDVPYL
ncbi:hypothetical protein Tco_1511953, partial [Tanacetum coccineum]